MSELFGKSSFIAVIMIGIINKRKTDINRKSQAVGQRINVLVKIFIESILILRLPCQARTFKILEVKMKKYGLLFMARICLVVMVFGHLHWKNMSQAAGIEGKKAEERIKEKEKEDREALIQSLKPENNKQQSLIDYLHYKSLIQDKVIVSLMGSNGTSGTGASNSSNSWAGRLEKSLRSERDELET
ncbi:hypothetical protein ABEY41_00260 [Peribacillus butanolivorans]|uniref:hypothetical protein n=1 Tax=Peribacillus butanolivorans TaxID=421767 RepID=UPI003D2C9DFC